MLARFSILLLVVGCGGAEVAPVAPVATGSVAFEGESVDGVRQGAWRVLHSGGAVAARGAYVDGKRDGKWTFFRVDAGRQAEGGYRAGERHGRWVHWDQGGTVSSDVTWKRGQRESVAVQAAALKSTRTAKCDRLDVRFRIRAAAGDLAMCHAGARADTPGLTGRIIARWMVSSDGQIDDVRLDGTIAHVAMKACVEQVLWRILYPLPAAGRCRVDWPLNFN
ncbi:MAG: hypothetical protein ACI9WU_001827 [Myxococcota bacterium]|jgi:hypothetical protein